MNGIEYEMKAEKRHYFSGKDFFPLFAIFLYIIWQILSKAVLYMDGAGRVPLTLIFCSFLLSFRYFKNFSRYEKRAVMIWFGWIIFQFLNLWIQGSDYSIYNRVQDLYFGLLGNAIFMFVCITQLKRRFYMTLLCILIGYVVNMILYYVTSSWQMATGYLRYTSDVINANEIGFHAVACTALIPILFAKFRKFLIPFAILSVFTIYLIGIIASRTSFVSVIPSFIAFIVLLLYHFKRNIFSILFILVCLILLFPVTVKKISKSTLFERFENREEFAYKELASSSTLIKYFGERSIYIESGIESFLEHPIFGNGYSNSQLYRYTGLQHSGYRNHVEYVAELADGGIVGFTLFMMMFINIIALFRQFVRKCGWKNLAFICSLQLLLALILFNFGLFTTNQTPFYVMFAVLLVYLGNALKKIESDKLSLQKISEKPTAFSAMEMKL